MFGGWAAWLSSVDAKYGAKVRDILTKQWPAAGPIYDAASLGIQIIESAAGLWGPFGAPSSRPIGLVRDPNNPNGAMWNPGNPQLPGAPLVLALTYDAAEFLIGQNMTGLGQGVIAAQYRDDPALQGDYTIYLKLYKTGGAPPAAVDELAGQCGTYRIDALPAFLGDGGATLTGFVPTGSVNEDMMATVSGWQPGGGSHPTALLTRRATQGGQPGLWFRLNFVNDVPNGSVWITFRQPGATSWSQAPQRAVGTLFSAPWH